jgi:signal transduction histidine kinase
MNPTQLEQLFAIRSSTRTQGTAGEQGSGLGLMFSMDLAKRLGGTIMVESTPGSGSTFSLLIPDHKTETPNA